MKTRYIADKFMNAKRRTIKTVERYNACIKSFEQMYPEMPTTAFEIEDWMSKVEGSDSNRALHYSVIRAMYKYAFEKIDFPDVFKKLHEPTIGKTQRRLWTAEELIAIGKTARPGLEQALILTLIDSTCRIGALGAHYATADKFYAGLHISNLNGNSFKCNFDKTGDHIYRLDPNIIAMLKSIAHPSGYIFVSTTGRPYTSHDLAQIVARLVKRAGITGAKLGAHTFRHTSLTLAAKATKSLLIVKALAQHDKAATSEIYIHLADEETQQEVSPLKLTEEFIHAKKPENSSQLALTAPDAQTEVITSQPTDDLSERMFPSIPAGKTARPALSFDDLTLMRTVFKFYVDKAPMNGNASKLVTLISRCVERPNKRGQPQ